MCTTCETSVWQFLTNTKCRLTHKDKLIILNSYDFVFSDGEKPPIMPPEDVANAVFRLTEELIHHYNCAANDRGLT